MPKPTNEKGTFTLTIFKNKVKWKTNCCGSNISQLHDKKIRKLEYVVEYIMKKEKSQAINYSDNTKLYIIAINMIIVR